MELGTKGSQGVVEEAHASVEQARPYEWRLTRDCVGGGVILSPPLPSRNVRHAGRCF